MTADIAPGSRRTIVLASRSPRRSELLAAAGISFEVLAADTTVVIDGQILGKPADAQDATDMLRLLQGRAHDVFTGVAVASASGVLAAVAHTRVWFRVMTDEDISWYVASGQPMDKAGAYGIQGLASRFIDRIDGSYTNVVGLPVAVVFSILNQEQPIRLRP